MRNIRRSSALTLSLSIACSFLFAACNTDRIPSEKDSLSETGMALSSAMTAPGDVTAVRYTIDRVACGGESVEPTPPIEADVPLMGFTLVGGLPGMPWNPVADGAEHFFSDLLVPVPSGCYDITAQPITNAGQNSVDCFSGSLNNVFIQSGKINEIVLISQCKNNNSNGYGNLPVVFNIPPGMGAIEYDPNKQVPKCQEQTICVTATDPENDPLQFDWVLATGAPVASGLTLVSNTPNADGSVTECQKITPGTAGGRTFNVKVYDMMIDTVTGNLIRYEDYFTSINDPQSSHAEYVVPSFAHDAPAICTGPNGNACSSDAQCAQGFCVDGVCCDSACTGTCQACAAAKKGSGIDGVCGPIAFDTNPDNECTPGSACDGQGTCKFYNGVPCGPGGNQCLAYCVDGVCCGNVCTGTCESCSAAIKGGGVDGACGPIAAGTDPDAECSGGVCNGAGVCTGGGCVAGTLLSSSCTGADLYGTYTDANCGTYTQVIQVNSPSCLVATCSDGIQNQGETGVDCGGPCAACPAGATCWDGIQNQGETGVDCGGPCAACPPVATCSDGIQNQGETGIDCGGPCAACVICSPAGTIVSQYCQNYDRWANISNGTFSNGTCGTYTQVLQACSALCGAPTAGWPISQTCVGANLVGTYHDGNCGTYTQVIEANSPSCPVAPFCGNGTCDAGECGACAADCPTQGSRYSYSTCEGTSWVDHYVFNGCWSVGDIGTYDGTPGAGCGFISVNSGPTTVCNTVLTRSYPEAEFCGGSCGPTGAAPCTCGFSGSGYTQPIAAGGNQLTGLITPICN